MQAARKDVRLQLSNTLLNTSLSWPSLCSNFFEKRVSEYQKAGVMSSLNSSSETGGGPGAGSFSLEADF